MTGNNSPLERLLDWCAVEVESLRLSNTIPSTGEIDDVATLQEIEQVEADIDAVRRDLTAPPTVPEAVRDKLDKLVSECVAGKNWAGDPSRYQIHLREAAQLAKEIRSALAQHSEPGRIPEGWKPAPVEPTDEMLDVTVVAAGDSSAVSVVRQRHREIYRAMIAAAPEPDATEES